MPTKVGISYIILFILEASLGGLLDGRYGRNCY